LSHGALERFSQSEAPDSPQRTPRATEEGVADASGLKREFYLSQLPVPSNIEVTDEEDGAIYAFVEGDEWTYSATRNSVIFEEYVPTALSTVDITYTALASLQGELQ
jgi:hypothetical protein